MMFWMGMYEVVRELELNVVGILPDENSKAKNDMKVRDFTYIRK